jgi:hypothetical protein
VYRGETAAPLPAVPPAETCRNCGAHTSGHFCGNCGQETRIALPTFPAFMREAAGRYVALDGRLWRTIAALVARPGYLTREYFNGRRRRYIRPARLFLVLYLLLFAVIGFVQPPGELSDGVTFVEPDPATKQELRDAARELKDAAKSGNDRPLVIDPQDEGTMFGLDKDLNLALRWNGEAIPVPERLRKRWDHFRKLSREDKAEQLYAGVLRYGPYAMVALLPAFALLLKLAYAGRAKRYPERPRRYAEHLVYSAHVHAFAALMIIALLLVPYSVARTALVLWILFYAMRARQVVYGGRWWGGLLRAFAIAVAYSVLAAFAILGLLAMAIMLR